MNPAVEFAQVTAFLFARKPPESFGQMALADKNKKAMLWIPGNRDTERPLKKAPTFFGVMPGAFMHRGVKQHEQPCYICWAGADFDLAPNTLPKVIKALRTVPQVSIRSSASGKGVHAFIRLDQPIKSEGRGHRTRVCKAVWTDLLHDLDIYDLVDKIDYRTFYVVGGLNEWIHQSDEFWPVEQVEAYMARQTERREARAVEVNLDEPPDACVRKVMDILTRHGVSLSYGRNNIYVRHIYEALLGTPYTFTTKSPMSGASAHTNGFIELTPTSLTLVPNADGYPVLTVRSKRYYEQLLKKGTQ